MRSRWILIVLLLFAVPILARAEEREMLVTAYCKCGECNGYTRGSWKFLKLDQWNRYVSEGSDRGQRYTGKTASGGRLVQANPGLISTDTAEHPSRIFGRLLPWNWFSRAGTIAADTRYYPFGTRMYIPEYGWGVVGDRGGAIKGPDHIDILFNHHAQTERWGNPHLMVKIVR